MQEAARAKGMQLHVLKAGTEGEIDDAFAALVDVQAGALVVATDPALDSRREQVIALASHHAVPAIYGFREFAAVGGLISCGPSLAGIYRQVGIYAGRILNGQKPAELPIVQPTKFELVINLKTAKALGLPYRRRCSPAPTRSSNDLAPDRHRRPRRRRGRRRRAQQKRDKASTRRSLLQSPRTCCKG